MHRTVLSAFKILLNITSAVFESTWYNSDLKRCWSLSGFIRSCWLFYVYDGIVHEMGIIWDMAEPK